MLQQGCPGEAQQKATAPPRPTLGPQSPCATGNTFSYSWCLGTDGKWLPGEGTHLPQPSWQVFQLRPSATSWLNAVPWCSGHCSLPAREDVIDSQGAAPVIPGGKSRHPLAADTQTIKINSWSHDGDVLWGQGLPVASCWSPQLQAEPPGKRESKSCYGNQEMAKLHYRGVKLFMSFVSGRTAGAEPAHKHQGQVQGLGKHPLQWGAGFPPWPHAN